MFINKKKHKFWSREKVKNISWNTWQHFSVISEFHRGTATLEARRREKGGVPEYNSEYHNTYRKLSLSTVPRVEHTC